MAFTDRTIMKLSFLYRSRTLEISVPLNSTLRELGHQLASATGVEPHTLRLLMPRSPALLPFSEQHASLSVQQSGISEGRAIRLMGVLPTEMEEVSEAVIHKYEKGIIGFEEEVRRAEQRAIIGTNTIIQLPKGDYVFCNFKTLELPGIQLHPPAEKALQIMHKLASDPGIVAIMNKHRWRVGIMTEMAPEGYVGISPECILGYNKNKGEEISLRLRTDDLKGFRKYESIKKTLLHELAHMVHSEHDAKFHALNSQLNAEANTLDWTKSAGHSLSGFRYSEVAESNESSINENRGQKLGGNKLIYQHGARSAAAQAALFRLSQQMHDVSEMTIEDIKNAGSLHLVDCNTDKQADDFCVVASTIEPDPDLEENNSTLTGRASLKAEPDPDLSEVRASLKTEPDPDLAEARASLKVEPDPDLDEGHASLNAEPDPDLDEGRASLKAEPDPDLSDAMPMEIDASPGANLSLKNIPSFQVNNVQTHGKAEKNEINTMNVPSDVQVDSTLIDDESESDINDINLQLKAKPDPDLAEARASLKAEPDPDLAEARASLKAEPDPDLDEGHASLKAEPDPDLYEGRASLKAEPDPDLSDAMPMEIDASPGANLSLKNIPSFQLNNVQTHGKAEKNEINTMNVPPDVQVDSTLIDDESESDINDINLQLVQENTDIVCKRIQNSIDLLKQEATPSQAAATIQTLLRIVTNVKEHPNDAKFRSLKKKTVTFHEKIAKFKGALEVLRAVGFSDGVESDALFLKRDDPVILWLAQSSLEVCIA